MSTLGLPFDIDNQLGPVDVNTKLKDYLKNNRPLDTDLNISISTFNYKLLSVPDNKKLAFKFWYIYYWFNANRGSLGLRTANVLGKIISLLVTVTVTQDNFDENSSVTLALANEINVAEFMTTNNIIIPNTIGGKQLRHIRKFKRTKRKSNKRFRKYRKTRKCKPMNI